MSCTSPIQLHKRRIICLDDRPATSWSSSKPVNAFATICIAYVFLWNIRSVGIFLPLLSTLPIAMARPLLHLDQYWNMFSPYPIKEDGWFVIPGKLRDGTEVDLFTSGGPVSWKKPPLITASSKNDRWKSYMMNLYFSEDNEAMLSAFARYLCIDWNTSHPHDKELLTFEVVFMRKVNKAGEPPKPYRKVVLWTLYCFEMPNTRSNQT